ncbi:sigma-70 family RNA polymerase sigma factor [Engelhardtia mirabilis]|uniref:RNA polymerase sigma factor n=1 Tax=Engelhardtia mirabilis TaxID=2528011 RepID=A0A518BNM9_9BACT|nr:ECF RNA polymerase sigma factor SigW [Planctomycetes bacterium Pla133]QDV02881.1 ECF RNA polymerase sigma factor SigW [Planctomycetes bacterium Pla86]
MSDSVTADFVAWRRGGDPRFLARVFDAVAPELLKLALHLVGDGATAEDLVQQAFLAAIEAPERFDGERPAGAWLAGILANRARRVHRERRRELDPERLERVLGGEDPSEALADRELSAALLRALDALPELYREPALLRFRHGLSPAEVAHALRRSPGTVRSQLHRAAELLRRAVPAGALPVWMLTIDAEARLGRLRETVLARAAGAPIPTGAAGALALVMGLKSWIVVALIVTTAVAVGGAFLRPEAASGEPVAAHSPSGGASLSSLDAVTTPDVSGLGPVDASRVEVEPTQPQARVAAVDPRPLLTIAVRRGGIPVEGRHFVARGDGAASTSVEVSGVTDSDGRARVGELREGTATVELGGGLTRTVELVAGEPAVAEFDLADSSRVAGRVVDGAGMPLAEARVWCLPRDGEPQAVARTDREGRFEFDGARTQIELRATLPGYSAAQTFHPRFLSRDVLGVELVLQAGETWLDLHLTDDGGGPVPGALVDLAPVLVEGATQFRGGMQVTDLPPGGGGRSSTDGTLRLGGLARGDYLLTVWADGFADVRTQVELSASREMAIALERGGTVAGQVVGADGRPVAGATVSRQGASGPLGFERGGGVTVETDDDGRFVLRAVPLERSVQILAQVNDSRILRTSTEVRLAGAGIDDLLLTFPPAESISGRVVFADGSPVGRASLIFIPDDGDPQGAAGATAEDDGGFAVVVRPDSIGTLYVDTPDVGGFADSGSFEGVRPSQSPHDLVLGGDPADTAGLLLSIVDARGLPAVGARYVVVDRRNRSLASGLLTEGQSTLDLGRRPPGPVSVLIESPAHGRLRSESFELVAGSTVEHTITLAEPGSIALDWSPRGAGEVELQDSEGHQVDSLWRDAGGQWRCPPLQPGRYSLALSSGGEEHRLEDLVVAAGEVLAVGPVDFSR